MSVFLGLPPQNKLDKVLKGGDDLVNILVGVSLREKSHYLGSPIPEEIKRQNMSMQQSLEEVSCVKNKKKLSLPSLIILQIHHFILVGRHQPQVRMPDKDKLETAAEESALVQTTEAVWNLEYLSRIFVKGQFPIVVGNHSEIENYLSYLNIVK